MRDRRRESFEELYRQTRADLLAYLLRRADSAEEAADLLAEAYLVAWRRLDAIPGGAETRPWLFGVARNLLLKGAARRRSRGILVERLADELRVSGAVEPSGGGEDRARLRAALTGLRETDREVLTLSAWEGLTPTEIAAMVGTSANVVRVRLHRARARLHMELGLPVPSQRDMEPRDRWRIKTGNPTSSTTIHAPR